MNRLQLTDFTFAWSLQPRVVIVSGHRYHFSSVTCLVNFVSMYVNKRNKKVIEILDTVLIAYLMDHLLYVLVLFGAN